MFRSSSHKLKADLKHSSISPHHSAEPRSRSTSAVGDLLDSTAQQTSAGHLTGSRSLQERRSFCVDIVLSSYVLVVVRKRIGPVTSSSPTSLPSTSPFWTISTLPSASRIAQASFRTSGIASRHSAKPRSCSSSGVRRLATSDGQNVLGGSLDSRSFSICCRRAMSSNFNSIPSAGNTPR